MKKSLKRIMAVMMAIMMCIPNNAATVLAASVDTASETSTETSTYVATISDVKHGNIKFTDYESVSAKDFTKGESVKITLTPDDGYKVSQLKVTNTDTGKVLAQKDTSDNRFAFSMPAKNVTITASFSQRESQIKLPETSEENTDATTEGSTEKSEDKTGDSSEDGEGETKTSEDNNEPLGTEESTLTTDIITLNLDEEIAEEVEQIAQNGLKESEDVNEQTFKYDDPNLVSEYDENGLAQTGHFVSMLYTIADKDEIENLGGIPEGADVSDWLFNGDEHITAFYTSMGEEVPIYATKESDDYYVAFVDVSKINRMGDCIYYTINTVDSENPESLEHLVKYDQNTGILYIPKTMYYDVEGKEHGAAFNVQLILSCDVSFDTGKTRVEIENHNGMIDVVAEQQTISTDLFDITTRIPLTTTETAKYFNQEHVKVYVNDSNIPMTDDGDSIAFDQETGELEIAHSGLTLYSVKIVIEDNTLSEKIISVFTKEAKAIKAADIKTMKKLSSFASIQAKINGGDHDGEGATDGSGNPILVKNVLNDGELYTYNGVYCYAPGSATVPNDDQRACLLGGIASSGNYLYWMTAVKEGDANSTFRTGTVTENDWDAGDAKNIINENVTLAASTQKSKYNVDFNGVYVDFVAQAPGAKTLTPVKSSGTAYKINLANDRDEWLRSKKTHKAHNVNIHGNAGTDVACTGNSSTDIKSNLIQWKTTGDWTNASSRTVGDVTFNTGTGNTTNSRSLLAMRCTQENSSSAGTTLDSNHKIYFRVLKHSTASHYIIFAITVDNSSSQSGHGIYKVTYSDTPTTTTCAIKLQKEINNAAYYAGNTFYTVNTATYRLYTDAACTTPAVNVDDEYIDLVVDLNPGSNTAGTATAGGIPEGTYYIKELPVVTESDSMGVNTDPNVYGPYTLQATDASAAGYAPETAPLLITYTDASGILHDKVIEPSTVDSHTLSISKYVNNTTTDPGTAVFELDYDMGAGFTKVAEFTVTGAGVTPNQSGMTMSNGQPINLAKLPIGSYRIYEISRSANITDRGTFTANGVTYAIPTSANPFYFTVREVAVDASTKDARIYIGETELSGDLGITVKNESKYYGFNVHKRDVTDPSNTTDYDLTAKFQLIAGAGENGTHVSVNPNPTTQNSDVGTSYNAGDVITTITTNAKGEYTSDPFYLSPGSYQIKEIQAPTGYRLDSSNLLNFTVSSSLTEGSKAEGGTKYNEPMAGSFAMQKYDNELDSITTQGGGSLNATFELVNDTGKPVVYKNVKYANGKVMDTFTLSAANNYTWFSGADKQEYGALRLGSYIVREKSAGTGYKNTKIKDAYGLDTNNEIHFTITKDYEVVWSGMSSFESTVKSHYAAAYPAITGFSYTKVTGNSPLNTYENTVKRSGFEIHKVDYETMDNSKGRDMTAAFKLVYRNTVNNNPVVIDKNKNGVLDIASETFRNGDTVFEFQTDKDGNFKSSDITNGNRLLPYTGPVDGGIYYELYETKAPKKYWSVHEMDDQVRFLIYVTDEGTTVYKTNGVYNYAYSTGAEPEKLYNAMYSFETDQKIPNVKKRYDINFTKKKEGEIDSKLLANVPFRITLLDDNGDPVESHVVWTDESGYYDSAADYASHRLNTNYGDNYTTYEKNGETYYKLDKSGLQANHEGAKLIGTWFYGFKGTAEQYADSKIFDYAGRNKQFKIGAFVDGNYTIEELRCEANEGLRLFSDVFNIQAFEDYYNKDLGTYDNADYGLQTIALTQDTDSHYAVANDELIIVDEVLYNGLKKGDTFRLVTSIHDAETGNLLLNSDGTDAKVEKTFVSKNVNGVVKVELDFDATGYEGRDLVIYEEVYDEEGHLLIKEEDPDNEDQQIHFPGITTKLTDTKSEDHLAKAAEGAVLKDVITFKNLEPERTYKVKGYLVDSETLDYARDDHGRKITAEKSFKPTKSTGEVEVTYEFDAATLAGKTYVAFEYVTRGGYDIALHEDIDDAEQTIHFPEIGTTAYDEETGTQMSYADDAITVVDTVAYSNVLAGYSYTMRGTLVDKADGEPLKDADGNVLVGETVFTAEDTSGTVDVVFRFDGTGMDSHTLVAYENLYMSKAVVSDDGEVTYEDVDIAEHSDIEDESETIYIPKIGTTAKDKENESRMSLADEEVTLTDTVEYENLIPGLKYEVEGFLMDKTVGDKLKDKDGNDITSVVEFSPEKANGTVDVEFTFDGSKLEGHTIVVYEYAYVIVTVKEEEQTVDVETGETTTATTESEERRIIGSHDDIDDEGQSIHFPDVNTLAYDGENQLNVTKSGEKEVIKDTVAYANVIAGEEYTITGRLFDKETGEVLKDEDGEEITASTKFVAQDTSGAAEIVFEVDTSKLAGHRLVAFEKLLYKEFEIGKHENPDDEDETVYVPKIGTTMTDINDMHMHIADDVATLTDTVEYEKLAPGYAYIMVGQLMNKATNEPIKLTNADTAESVMAKLKETIADNDARVATQTAEDETEDDGLIIVGRDINAGYYKLKGRADDKGNVFAKWSIYASEDNKTVPDVSGNPVANGVITDSETSEYIRLVNNQVLVIGDNVILESSSEADAAGNLNATLAEYYNNLPEEALDQKSVAEQKKNSSIESDSQDFIVGYDVPAGYYKIVGTPDEDGNINAKWSIFASDDNATVPENRNMPVANGVITDNTTSVFIRVVNNQVLRLNTSAVTVSATEDEVGEDLNSTLKAYYVGLTEDEMNQIAVTPEEQPELTDEEKAKLETEEEAKNILNTIANKRRIIDNSFDWGALSDGTQLKFADTYEDDIAALDGTAVCMVFTPDAADGKVDLTFEVDASELKGITTVAFEELYLNGFSVAEHKDIEDEGQSVHFPDVHTTATDAEKNVHYTEAGTKTTIRDIVEYKNVIPGEVYKVTGTLMDKETKAAVIKADGTPVTAEVEITPETEDGTVTLDFVFDSTNYAGHSLVVYEDLYTNGVLVGKHEDLEDKDQTVNVVKVHTSAIDAKTETNIVKEGKTTIIDTVYYEGLTPGETYVMSGILMDKETGESLKSSDKGDNVATLIADIFGKSNEYISEAAFVPETSSGTVQIMFNIDSTDFDGKTIVAFEKLYFGTTVIAKHEDIEDTEQTVYVPKIGTKATVGNQQTAEGKKKTTLVDTIEYTNLVPGKEYTVKGTLMDKKTGKAFKVGGKKVTASKTFTPKNANGTVKLKFKFNSTKAEKIVVFERLYYNGIKIAQHTDINDKDQTVTFKSPEEDKTTPSGTPSEKVKTGDSWMMILILLLIAGGSFGAYAYTKKKKNTGLPK